MRELLDSGDFVEVFVDTPLERCIARDPRASMRGAAGEIKNFTGFDQPYEAPECPNCISWPAEKTRIRLPTMSSRVWCSERFCNAY